MQTPVKPLHAAQINILYELRHTKSARYRDVLHASGLENDGFRFHLNTLLKCQYIKKNSMGGYALTPAGKEFANNLNKTARTPLKQPKLSLALVITRKIDGSTQYLLQQRKRQPYYNFWGHISGPVVWDEEPEKTASTELYKQTGLYAECKVWSFFRQRDYINNRVREDKQFIILHSQDPEGKIKSWRGGISKWMTIEELQLQPLFFPETLTMATMSAGAYQSKRTEYNQQEY